MAAVSLAIRASEPPPPPGPDRVKARTVTDLESQELASENEASKVENCSHQFLDHFKSILVILLILLGSPPQTLSNNIKMNKIRPILINRQQFQKLVHRFLKCTSVSCLDGFGN